MNDEDDVDNLFKYTDEAVWFLRDSRSSPYVRIVGGAENRFNPSPELNKFEAVHGMIDTQHKGNE